MPWHRRKKAAPKVEALEDRTTPAVRAVFADGMLTVRGDAAANAVSVGVDRLTDQVVVRDGSRSVTISGGAPEIDEVVAIRVELRGGDDVYRDRLRGRGLDIVKAILGGEGDDRLVGGQGAELLQGERGRDILIGRAGDDSLSGGAGDDQAYGRRGDDRLDGGAGDDRLDGGAGDDRLDGGSGDDTYVFDADATLGADTIADAGGTDSLDFSGTTLDVVFNLITTTSQTVVAGNLTLVVPAEAADDSVIEAVFGGAGNDSFKGGAGSNTLLGGAGDDHLVVHGARTGAFDDLAADVLDGGEGNDILIGAPTDSLTGGAGVDQFYLIGDADVTDREEGEQVLFLVVDNPSP